MHSTRLIGLLSDNEINMLTEPWLSFLWKRRNFIQLMGAHQQARSVLLNQRLWRVWSLEADQHEIIQIPTKENFSLILNSLLDSFTHSSPDYPVSVGSLHASYLNSHLGWVEMLYPRVFKICGVYMSLTWNVFMIEAITVCCSLYISGSLHASRKFSDLQYLVVVDGGL